MEVERFFSAVANDGILSLASALVVLLVLRWALSSPAWNVEDEPLSSPAGAALPTAAARPPVERADETSPLPRVAGRHAQPAGHATGLVRAPEVSGGPPWGPAPRPPGLR